jgi:transposase-like protein
MKRIPDAFADSLMKFVKEAIEPGSIVHTDGWPGYDPLERVGYVHNLALPEGARRIRVGTDAPSAPDRVPAEALDSGNSQRAVSHEHLEYYLDEFTFRFNRRRSGNRARLFYRLGSRRSPSTLSRTNPWSCALPSAWSPTTTFSGYVSEVKST